jgi:4-amino-4-deoxy-L-arabinose transferase-like glycosyltransferase
MADRGRATWFACAFALAVAVRLAFGLVYWTDKPLTKDEHEYLSLARSLVAGQGLVYDAALPGGEAEAVGRAPGYPVFLALTGGGTRVVNAVPGSVKAAQAIVGGLGVLVVGAVALRLAGPDAALVAALAASVYPPLVWVSSYAWSEAIAWPLGLCAIGVFDRLARRDRRHDVGVALGAGVLVGLTVLVRPGTILFLPAGVLWLWTHGRRRAAAWLVVGSLAAIAPWSARNYVHYGRAMFVASEGGVTFWTGNHPLATGDGDLSTNPALKADQRRLEAQHPGSTDVDLESVYYGEALAWIRAHPVAWLGLELRKSFFIVVPVGPSYAQHSRRYAVSSALSYLIVLPFAAAGFLRLGAARRRTPGLWLLAASSIAVALIFFPQERFRIPVVDPALIVCASTLVARRDRIAERRNVAHRGAS